MLRSFRRRGLSGTARAIRSALEPNLKAGTTSLELGCGIGALTLSLLKRGVVSAVGLDLSPRLVGAARTLAAEEGVSGSVSFRVADGARAPLDGADLVILDAVLCCYPDVVSLVDNSSSAARRFYTISLPDDQRPAVRLLRPLLPLQSVFIRRGAFRFFIHPKKQIVGQLENKGFRLVSETPVGLFWSVLLFAAPSGN